MKILYVICLYNGEITGGHSYRMATVKALQNIYGKKSVDIVLSELDTCDWGCNVVLRLSSYKSVFSKLFNLLSGNITQRSNQDINKIISLINNNDYDVVIFGSSETGKLIREVKKKCAIKTVSWYHDIVADVLTKRLNSVSPNMFKKAVWNMEIKSEGIDARLTDLPIVLHKRDADLLYKYWHRKAEVFVPIVLNDSYIKECVVEGESDASLPLKLLFVGAYNWSVNVEAVQWFCENVMSILMSENVVFCIAGFQMEKLRESEWVQKYDNVRVLGTVDDLNETYREADVVVEPIITGSGMKVKTAEALMHGKEILGTTEALIGYDQLGSQICNTPEEFVEKIRGYLLNRPQRFNEMNRKYYLDHFSPKAIEVILKHAIDKLLTDRYEN